MRRVFAGVLSCVLLACLTASPVGAAVPTGYLNASNRFVWQQPSPQGNSLGAADFVTDTLGWAIGVDGTVIRTADGGATWTQQGPIVPQGDSSMRTNLWDVSFVDANTGYVAGSGAVYKTANAGASWAPINAWSYDGINPREIAYVSVDFPDANNGWFIGSYSVWHTTNGGTTVDRQTVPAGFSPTHVDAPSSSTAYATGLFDGYLKTTDGGATWVPHAYAGTGHTVGWTNSIAAANAACVWAVVGGDLLRTTDGGSIWTTQTVGNRGNDPVMRVCSVDGDLVGNAAYALTEGGRLYRTGDGGQTWVPMVESRRFSNMTDLDAPSGYGLRCIDRGRLVTSDNGGADWDASSQTSQAYLSVDFTSSTRGYAITPTEFASTVDGGNTWAVADWSARDILMNDVFFLESNPLVGWIVGAPNVTGASTVLKTVNGGITWDAMPEKSMVARGVYFADALNGFAYDNAWGRFYRSTDGGASWAPVTRDGWFRDVDFVDASNGWIAVSTGDGYDRLLRTSDGGSTWTTQTVQQTGGEVLSVDFADARVGYASDSFAGVWKTTDGGATWTQKRLTPYAPAFTIKRIRSVSATECWVIGTQMTSEVLPSPRHDFAAHTVDGGTNWDFWADPEASDRGSTGSFVGISALDSSGGETWVVGGNGSILKVRPRTIPVVGNPVAPKTMYRTRYAKVYGTLKPHHLSGVSVVRIYKEQRGTTGWKSAGYVTAKAVDYSTYSRYEVRLKIKKAGKYRLRAFSIADGVHTEKWSTGYRYVTVK